jgi:2-methylcitrate dehydratase PrpD
MTRSIEAQLSELAVETPASAIPEPARRAAVVQVFDTVGVTLAAVAHPAGRLADGLVRDLGGAPQARVLGTGTRTSTVQAAWANGTLAHLLDFDDVGFSHPTATILPGALAVAEHLDVDGRTLLEAMVIGYEVFERLAASGRDDDPRLRERGYHPTPIYGAIAATAAAGRLLGLDPGQMTVAFGLAATDASGLTQQFGTWGKGIHAGNAARTGVFYALLAKAGYWADPVGLSGPRGLFSAVHGEGRYDFAGVSDELGERWSILEPGLALKVYPACGSSRRGLDALLQLVRDPAYAPERVERIVLDVHPHVFNQLQYRAPMEGFRGKFSLDYVIAAAALDRDVTIETFSDERALRPEFREMLSRVELREHPEWGIDHWRDQPVEIVLRDGTVLRAAVDSPRGTRRNPLSRDEIVAKFIGCAERSLGLRRAGDAVDVVWNLDGASSVRGVIDALVT